MEVAIYKPDFIEKYGKLTPSTILKYVKQEYPVDENITEQDIEIYHENDYARVVIKMDRGS
jgi:outer membrane translocation and assembly module TamA